MVKDHVWSLKQHKEACLRSLTAALQYFSETLQRQEDLDPLLPPNVCPQYWHPGWNPLPLLLH